MRNILITGILLILSITLTAQTPDSILLSNYRPTSAYKIPSTNITKAKFPVIDMHSHPYASCTEELERWVRIMDEFNIEKTIILTYATGARFDSLFQIYNRFNDRFEVWCGFDYTGFYEKGWSQKAIKELERCFRVGARGVGELGDKGSGLKYSYPSPANGMHIDDERMQPLIRKCGELGMPINIHVAEPIWMYNKQDSTNDGLMNGYKWRVDLTDPDILNHHELLLTLENAVKQNPGTMFIACHFANCSYDLSLIGKLLDQYPNLYADISARYGETAPIPRYMNNFYSQYQDRLLFGTDMGYEPTMYNVVFRILETEDEHFYQQDYFNYHWPLHGFGLNDNILKKLYYENAQKYWINALWIVSLASCASNESKTIATIQTGDLELIINDQLFTSVNSLNKSSKPITELSPSEYLIGDNPIDEFELISKESKSFTGPIGSGTRHVFTGLNQKTGIEKSLVVTQYDSITDMLFFQTAFTNTSKKEVLVKELKTNAYHILNQGDNPPFWAFQGSSSSARADWIKPIEAEYYQKNYMGMNNSDYGGGIPVTDIWRSDIGITIGHTAMTPKLISLPTELKKHDKNVTISIQQDFDYPFYLAPGEYIEALPSFVAIHEGDYYNGLNKYSQFMQRQGIEMPEPEPAAFESIWCAWGYGRKFNLKEVLATIPKVKEFGIKWAVLDDGYQIAEGDWHLNSDKFPKGDVQMKEFVHKVHEAGLKAKLWWAPLAADPGSRILQEHPEARLYLEDWSPQYITWWDAYYLSPTNPVTIQHTREVVDMFMNDWGFDGLKLDGQHMNAVAPDHNPASGLEDPNQAPEKLPEFFQLIYNEAININPNAVVENCPCGTCMSFFNMPFMNQSVSSDPLSSWQIRHKGKTYKALIPKTAYYGDHVELSDNGNDFASSFGIGAVLGTKFVWPKANTVSDEAIPALTTDNEALWKKWFTLYNEKMLSKETYLGGLYDIGYDLPETHVIQKGDTLHYAFYAEKWDQEIELRGLQNETYIVRDYVNDHLIGEVSKTKNLIKHAFEDALLIEVYPKQQNTK